jgi:hypothetical protein
LCEGNNACLDVEKRHVNTDPTILEEHDCQKLSAALLGDHLNLESRRCVSANVDIEDIVMDDLVVDVFYLINGQH